MSCGSISRSYMAGQHLMLGFDGTRLNDDLKFIINDIHAGGIILFARNIESPSQVADLCASCQEYAAQCGALPLFIAVDQEGGVVARLTEGFTRFKGNPYVEDVRAAEHFASVTAAELKKTGFNMNFAPVLDWAPPGVDSIMKDRVFKGDYNRVAELGAVMIDSLQKAGIMAVAKHFPGIGRTIRDSHYFLPVLDIDLKTLESSDMVPFFRAIVHDVSGVMLSHISYPRLDDQWQASLSPFIADGILRKQMGFNGLIMTDDLDMKAIRTDIQTCIRQILSAGIDLALICRKGPNIKQAHQEIISCYETDAALYENSCRSYERIAAFKAEYLQPG